MHVRLVAAQPPLRRSRMCNTAFWRLRAYQNPDQCAKRGAEPDDCMPHSHLNLTQFTDTSENYLPKNPDLCEADDGLQTRKLRLLHPIPKLDNTASRRHPSES